MVDKQAIVYIERYSRDLYVKMPSLDGSLLLVAVLINPPPYIEISRNFAKNFFLKSPLYKTTPNLAKKFWHAPSRILTPFPYIYKFPCLGLYPRGALEMQAYSQYTPYSLEPPSFYLPIPISLNIPFK